jgi:hypothetical protein
MWSNYLYHRRQLTSFFYERNNVASYIKIGDKKILKSEKRAQGSFYKEPEAKGKNKG